MPDRETWQAKLAARGQPVPFEQDREAAIHDDPRLQLRGGQQQLVVGRKELVEGAARRLQGRGGARRRRCG